MKKIVSFILFLLTLAISTQLHAQKYELSGNVQDSATGENLIGASVFVIELKTGTTSDVTGFYKLELEPGQYHIVSTAVGYESDTLTYTKVAYVQAHNFLLSIKPIELDVVTITGSKYAKKLSEEIISIEVLKSSVIENSNAQLNDAVQKIPGVNMVGENISIRGGSGYADGANSRVSILLDDLPLLGGDDGGITWNAMPVECTDQVEVLKGAGSALYGSASMNGVINVRTADASNEQAEVKFTVNAGGYAKPAEKHYAFWYDSLHHHPWFVNTSVLYRQRLKIFDVSAGATYSQDGSYLYADAQKFARAYLKLRHNSKRHEGLNYGVNTLVYHFSGKEFFVWKDTGQSILFPREEMQSYERNLSISPYINYYDSKEGKHTARIKYYNRNSGTENGLEFSNASQLYADYTYNRSFTKSGIVVTSGCAFTYNFVKSKQYGNVHSTNAGAYVQADKIFWKRLTLSLGMRVEYNKADSIRIKNEILWLSDIAGRADSNRITSPVVPVLRTGMNLEIVKGTNLRVSYGQGFRYPTIVELFTDVVRSGIHVYPNTQLQPESGWTAEAGIKQGVKVSKWVGYFDASAFISRYHNMTEFEVGLYGSPPTLGARSQNVEEVQITGFELTAFSQGKIKNNSLSFIAGYAYMQPIDLTVWQKYDSVFYLKYRSKSQLKADVQFAARRVEAGISILFNSKILQVDPLIEALGNIYAYRTTHDKGYWVADARVSYRFSPKFKLAVIAKNLLNTEYYLRPGKLEAPRNYTVQLIYEI